MRNLIIALVAVAAVALLAGQANAAVTTTITGTTGGSDSWNTTSNWDNGVPDGDYDAIIAANVAAKVQNDSTPSYTGTLTLNNNSSLQVGWTYTQNYPNNTNALGSAGITMKSGSQIGLRMKKNIDLAGVTLLGDAQISNVSTESHHRHHSIPSLTGDGAVTLQGPGNDGSYVITGNNSSWSGGMTANGGDDWIEANAGGSLGTGDVTINDGVSLLMGAANVMDDGATLYLNGAESSKGPADSKLEINGDDTIGSLIIDSSPQAPGDYTANSGDWISGTGTLTVVPVPEPATMVLIGIGGIGVLLRRRRRA